MQQQIDIPRLDDLGRSAVADAVKSLGATPAKRQAYIQIDRRNVCVTAVHAPSESASAFAAAAARRASIPARRLLPVIDSGEFAGWHWIAYDMADTTPLSDHRKHLLLPTSSCLRLLWDVARALDDAAEDDLFASEVPPESLFLTRRGVRLGDLGTAREAWGAWSPESRTDTAYVPPEVLRGEAAAGRSGVWVFGALLYHLLSGASPRRGASRGSGNGASMTSLAARRLDLPPAVDSVVASAMADEPRLRPRSASDAHILARSAIRGEGAALGPGAWRRPATPEPRSPGKVRGPGRDELEFPGPTPKASWSAVAPLLSEPKPAAEPRAQPAGPDQGATGSLSRRGIAAVAVAGALVLGIGAGVLLGASSAPESDRATTATGGGVRVTVPPGWQEAGTRAGGLAIRPETGAAAGLEANFVEQSPEPQPSSKPVQLGSLQAWRSEAPGELRYAAPTTRGTVLISCTSSPPTGTSLLRLCERAASTLRLRGASALPLAGVVEEEDSLRSAVAALRAERDAGRSRLARAGSRRGQRLAAQALARSYARAATALEPLSGAEPVEAAVREAARAYDSLAASAASGSARRWEDASEGVRRRDATLAVTLAAQG